MLPTMPDLVFPPDFLWGTATAAHQVEGGNDQSDWWDWELRPGTPCREPSGQACDHYQRYPDDVALLAGLGFNIYRFSVEWARIEPADGLFDEAQLQHYRQVAETVRRAGMAPMVTLHHFTLPRWVDRRGGWASRDVPALFERYCRRVVAALGETVDWYCTINEPGVVAFGGYLGALGFPPGKRDVGTWKLAIDGLIKGHRRALGVVRETRPGARVGATHSMQEWEANDGGRSVMGYIRRLNEDVFLAACTDDDFVGVQTYTRVRITLPGFVGPVVRLATALSPVERALVPWLVSRKEDVARPGDTTRRTQMGYEFRPEAAAATTRRAASLLPGKDLVVTEHGVATDDDAERIEFIERGLTALHGLLDEGLPLRGYVHWSAFDNFEWVQGYAMRFGLIGVDRTTQVRTVKPSARRLGEIARTGRLAAPA